MQYFASKPESASPLLILFLCSFLFQLPGMTLHAQPEVQAWGNLRGMRIEGQLIKFESSVRIVGEAWGHIRATGKERNWTSYSRKGQTQVVESRMDSLFFTQKISPFSKGEAKIELEISPKADLNMTGLFFQLSLPLGEFEGAEIIPVSPAPLSLATPKLASTHSASILKTFAKGIEVENADRRLAIVSEAPLEYLVIQPEPAEDLEIYVCLHPGDLAKGASFSQTLMLEVSGTLDTATAEVKIFPDFPGQPFLGLGGNFRLQNPKTDPQVIDYCLENLDVRMGRVEMPWRKWHPDARKDPLAEARAGRLDPHVRKSMEMAARLHKMGMPVLLAGWFPPDWAINESYSSNPRKPDGTWGHTLNQSKAEEIYASLSSYVLYLKEAYGVEAVMFSFNESDLGINVRQSAEDHAKLIRELGAHFKSKGLKTKLLLGDTADANGFNFVNTALDDPETWAYIGAVSFHSWRGWKHETLLEWMEAADRINVPLIVGEGSIDAAAWRYPQIFEESHYAMEEMKLYVRMLALCQPQTILQWQLTADYSPLAGGGIFGDDSPLRPTQRFWNLKQLSQTPANLHWLPAKTEHPDLYVTALGDRKGKQIALHLANDGPARTVHLTGLPPRVKRLQVWTTSPTQNMEKGPLISVIDGKASFRVPATSFVSLW